MRIEEEDISRQVKEWENAVIGYVLGGNPYEEQMNEYVKKVWKFVSNTQVLWHDNGYFIFKFQMIAEKEKVMQARP